MGDITAPEMFQELAPEALLPWREHKFRRGLIVDAKGEEVCCVDGIDWRNIASMIIVAVNTCGGFKAEISYDPTTQPFDEPLRHIDTRSDTTKAAMRLIARHGLWEELAKEMQAGEKKDAENG